MAETKPIHVHPVAPGVTGATTREVQQAKTTQIELSLIKESATSEGRMVLDHNNEFDYALAPNGEKSHLNEVQWLSVRSTQFKRFFGDWENNKDQSSKLIDDNGEPLVLYHGTTREFDTFSHDAPKTFDLDNVNGVFFLTSDREFAEAEYGKFKLNLIIEVLKEFNEKFFDSSAASWDPLIDKWNDFIRSIGTDKVNFEGKVSDGRGGYRDFTIVEYDGKPIFATQELEKLWDSELSDSFVEDDYEIDTINGREVVLPKNSKQIIMELFVDSRNPIHKKVVKEFDIFEMDGLFNQGITEKGICITGEKGMEEHPSFASKPKADSIVVELTSGQIAVAVFEPSQIKSAKKNNGTFSKDSDNIYE